MSVTDPSAEPVQPEGQGGDEASGGGSPWESYLERFPEDSRDVAAEAFREMEGNATKRFQEHSEYRKSWEPYENLGLNQVAPDDVQEALQFRQAVLENPQGVWDWAQQYAQHHGLTPAEAAAAEFQQQEEFGAFGEQLSQQQLDQLVEQRLTPLQQQLGEMAQWRQSLEEQAHQDQVNQGLRTEMEALKEKHSANLPPELRDQFEEIIGLHGMKYAEPGADPKHVVERAWADFQVIYNSVEKAALQGKVDAPAPAEGGGVPDVSPDKVVNFKQAEAAAAEFLRNNRG